MGAVPFVPWPRGGADLRDGMWAAVAPDGGWDSAPGLGLQAAL